MNSRNSCWRPATGKVRTTENRMMNERNYFQSVSLATGAEEALVSELAGCAAALLGSEGEKSPFNSHHSENWVSSSRPEGSKSTGEGAAGVLVSGLIFMNSTINCRSRFDLALL